MVSSVSSPSFAGLFDALLGPGRKPKPKVPEEPKRPEGSDKNKRPPRSVVAEGLGGLLGLSYAASFSSASIFASATEFTNNIKDTASSYGPAALLGVAAVGLVIAVLDQEPISRTAAGKLGLSAGLSGLALIFGSDDSV